MVVSCQISIRKFEETCDPTITLVSFMRILGESYDADVEYTYQGIGSTAQDAHDSLSSIAQSLGITSLQISNQEVNFRYKFSLLNFISRCFFNNTSHKNSKNFEK